MTQPDDAAWRRLYEVMQHLMVLAAEQKQPEPAAPRGEVTLEDARTAVIQLAAVISVETETGRIPAEQSLHAAAMLMLVRDYIEPLPVVPGNDPVTPDLVEVLTNLRRDTEETGVRG